MAKDSKKNINDERREYLRKKIMKSDDANILNHEMLELLLLYVVSDIDVSSLAHNIINTFGSVSAAMDSEIEELIKVPGVTEKTAQYLAILGKFGRAYSRICHQSVSYNLNTEKTKRYMRDLFRDIDKEQAYMLCFDSNKQIVKRFLMFEGTFKNVNIYVNDAIKQILMCDVRNVACIHNHPSGSAVPSYKDRECSRVIKEILSSVGINLFDSLIYADSKIYSILKGRTYEI